MEIAGRANLEDGILLNPYPPNAPTPWRGPNPGRDDIQGELSKKANIGKIYKTNVGQPVLLNAPQLCDLIQFQTVEPELT